MTDRRPRVRRRRAARGRLRDRRRARQRPAGRLQAVAQGAQARLQEAQPDVRPEEAVRAQHRLRGRQVDAEGRRRRRDRGARAVPQARRDGRARRHARRRRCSRPSPRWSCRSPSAPRSPTWRSPPPTSSGSATASRSSLKMDKEEVKQEHKRRSCPNEVKGAQRRRAMELARARMMDAVPTADVVVTNPTHFSVALRYDSEKPGPDGRRQGHGPPRTTDPAGCCRSRGHGRA